MSKKRRIVKAPRRFNILRQQVVQTCAKVLGSRSSIKKRGGALSPRERDFILASIFLGREDPRLRGTKKPPIRRRTRALPATARKRSVKLPRDPITGKFLPRKKRRKT